MKKSLTLLGLVSCMLLAYAQAGTDDKYLKQAYQPATVVSITNLTLAPLLFHGAEDFYQPADAGREQRWH